MLQNEIAKYNQTLGPQRQHDMQKTRVSLKKKKSKLLLNVSFDSSLDP